MAALTLFTNSARVGVWRVLRDFASAYPRHVAVLVIAVLVEAAVAMIAVLALVPFADYLLDQSLRHPSGITEAYTGWLRAWNIRVGFGVLGLTFVGANLLKAACDVGVRYVVLRTKYAVIRGLFADALGTFFRARWQFFSGAEHGRLLNTLHRELNVIGDTLGHLATQFGLAAQLLVYLSLPFWVNSRMTLIALGLSLLIGAPVLLLHRAAYRLGRRNTETANVMMSTLSEMLGAARIILGFGRQSHARDRFLDGFDRHAQAAVQSQTLAAGAGAVVQPIGMLAAIVAMGLALREGTPAAEMAALLWSLLRAFPLMTNLLTTNVTISTFLPSYEQLLALRREAAALEEVPGGRPFTSLEHGIDLQDVDFTYPGRIDTLRGVSLSIARGKTVALVGESGSGKSTVADLVLGLQVPGAGRVMVDGVPLGDWNQNSFRSRVGYVPQDPVLFHSSIHDNLIWAAPDANESDLWEACRMANAETFIRSLPQGLDTVVGDRGVRMSGGQRQRVALARALLRRPDLLILDEATSSLDSESERLIQQAIDNLAGATTLLVIAHRLSTIARADVVYVMDRGRVVEAGSYADLAHRPGSTLSAMIAGQRVVGRTSASAS